MTETNKDKRKIVESKLFAILLDIFQNIARLPNLNGFEKQQLDAVDRHVQLFITPDHRYTKDDIQELTKLIDGYFLKVFEDKIKAIQLIKLHKIKPITYQPYKDMVQKTNELRDIWFHEIKPDVNLWIVNNHYSSLLKLEYNVRNNTRNHPPEVAKFWNIMLDMMLNNTPDEIVLKYTLENIDKFSDTQRTEFENFIKDKDII